MAHPWLKKNPFMSMWLSTAHRIAGSTRGRATAQATGLVKRTAAQMATENLKLWFGGATVPVPKKKTRKR